MTDRSPAITPVLLAGGAGTRLWPASRRSWPKQFVPLLGEKSLFRAAVARLAAPGFAPPLVITGEAYRFLVAEQLQQEGRTPAALLIEPDGRNTAPAALVAALWLAGRDPGALMLLAPSDHAIADPARFAATVAAAAPAARAGRIVTFGIRPDRAETGYGWLELAGEADPAAGAPHPLARFIEKPDAARADAMLASGRHLWNAGIFLAPAEALIAAFRAHAPEMIAPAEAALAAAECDLGFTRLAAAPWAELPDISIDYAIMEKAANLAVMPYGGAWSDLGDWQAIWRAGERDGAGNLAGPRATALDCSGTLLHSDGPRLVGIGLEDMLAVATGDAVLVAPRDQSQRVKEAVAALRAEGAAQADAFPADHRPWGHFESLARGRRFQVKRIVVKPGGVLSLQSHHHRSEHWIVVQGTAKVTIGDDVRLVTENESVYVPLGARHRMENPGKLEMVLIEVQTGSYLGEDDIVRYEDAYARG